MSALRFLSVGFLILGASLATLPSARAAADIDELKPRMRKYLREFIHWENGAGDSFVAGPGMELASIVDLLMGDRDKPGWAGKKETNDKYLEALAYIERITKTSPSSVWAVARLGYSLQKRWETNFFTESTAFYQAQRDRLKKLRAGTFFGLLNGSITAGVSTLKPELRVGQYFSLFTRIFASSLTQARGGYLNSAEIDGFTGRFIPVSPAQKLSVAFPLQEDRQAQAEEAAFTREFLSRVAGGLAGEATFLGMAKAIDRSGLPRGGRIVAWIGAVALTVTTSLGADAGAESWIESAQIGQISERLVDAANLLLGTDRKNRRTLILAGKRLQDTALALQALRDLPLLKAAAERKLRFLQIGKVEAKSGDSQARDPKLVEAEERAESEFEKVFDKELKKRGRLVDPAVARFVVRKNFEGLKVDPSDASSLKELKEAVGEWGGSLTEWGLKYLELYRQSREYAPGFESFKAFLTRAEAADRGQIMKEIRDGNVRGRVVRFSSYPDRMLLEAAYLLDSIPDDQLKAMAQESLISQLIFHAAFYSSRGAKAGGPT